MVTFFDTSFCFIIIISTVHGLFHDHYPDDAKNPRPCSQKQYTVREQQSICILSDRKHETFSEESIAACSQVSSDCPEFNFANCEILEQKFGDDFILKFPVCRAAYTAEVKGEGTVAKFWMQVFYVNQFGTKAELANVSIIEIKRHVHRKKKGLFPFEQEDFPKNVLSETGVQGLNWEIINLPNDIKTDFSNEALLCIDKRGNEDCETKVPKIFETLYNSKKLYDYQGIELFSARCDQYIVLEHLDYKMNELPLNKICRVKYNMTTMDKKFSQIVLEGQAYYDVESKKMVYRKATYGGNSVNPDGTLNTY